MDSKNVASFPNPRQSTRFRNCGNEGKQTAGVIAREGVSAHQGAYVHPSVSLRLPRQQPIKLSSLVAIDKQADLSPTLEYPPSTKRQYSQRPRMHADTFDQEKIQESLN